MSVLMVRASEYDTIRGYIHPRDLFIQSAPVNDGMPMVTLKCGDWSAEVSIEELLRVSGAAWELWGKKLPGEKG